MIIVSIPRSEFWSFGHGAFVAGGGDVGIVSIPRSEFWSFGRAFKAVRWSLVASFNSSVGILVVRTQ